jgi:hypothetical protein
MFIKIYPLKFCCTAFGATAWMSFVMCLKKCILLYHTLLVCWFIDFFNG